MDMGQNNSGSSPGEHFDTIVIGGGQAGLAVGYFLMRQGVNFVILDENCRTGDSWRRRWESLKLFTPSKFNSLPGLPFPKSGDYLPQKDEVADYLEGYVHQFDLPVRHDVKVENLSRTDAGYQISTGKSTLFSKHVVVATGPFQSPHIPEFGSQLDPVIQQLHTSVYCNPEQIQGQSVLVVGAGNSGAEISIELADAGKRVWLSGRDVGRIPANGPLGKVFGGRPIWWFMSHVLTVNTPIGRKVRAGELHRGTPLGRLQRQDIAASGVELAPRLSGIQAGNPQLEDGRILQVGSVVWATGFRPNYQWINLPIFDETGYPRHWRGVVPDAPGLYFVGLLFQTALSSSLLGGVGTDAAYITQQIARNGVPA
jgi:putative flavoprotein involved in K+ transport